MAIKTKYSVNSVDFKTSSHTQILSFLPQDPWMSKQAEILHEPHTFEHLAAQKN